MTEWLILSVAIPAMTAALLVLAARHHPILQRALSIAATVLQLAVAIALYGTAGDGETRVYLLGHWPPPFGIVLVLDRLAALMLLLAAVVALGAVLASASGWDRRGRHFHALFQFQLLGVNGAFLTGDLFNLFVFFEVLLIASYGLALHGGGPARLKAGFHYVAINLVGSTIFLFAVGTIYAVTGTLNMADLAAKVPRIAAGNEALLTAGALLLLCVFAIKAALAPLHWWLPTTYGSASPPAAALFAIMTKVGAYSIIRVYSLIFGADAGPLAGVASPFILPAAVATLCWGTIGALASRRLLDLVSYTLIASMGTLLIAVGLASTSGLAAALYYAVQSTLATAGLFLLCGIVADGTTRNRRPPLRAMALMAGFYLALAMASVGMPPLAGFIGKLLILDAARDHGAVAAIWAAVLVTSLLLVAAFARAGIAIFWTAPLLPPPAARAAPVLPIVVVGGMIAAMALLSGFAGPVMRDMRATAHQVLEPHRYLNAVLAPVTASVED